MFIAALFTIARSWKQPKCPSTDEWIKKMWYIYTMEYYSSIKRKKIGSFVETWMDLETVIQSEVSQNEKNKYCNINTYMWNTEKWYRWTSLQGRNRDTDVENKRMDTKGESGGGVCVKNWEIGIDIYTLICIKWITNKNLLYKKINKIKFKTKTSHFLSDLPIICPSDFLSLGFHPHHQPQGLFIISRLNSNITPSKKPLRILQADSVILMSLYTRWNVPK